MRQTKGGEVGVPHSSQERRRDHVDAVAREVGGGRERRHPLGTVPVAVRRGQASKTLSGALPPAREMWPTSTTCAAALFVQPEHVRASE